MRFDEKKELFFLERIADNTKEIVNILKEIEKDLQKPSDEKKILSLLHKILQVLNRPNLLQIRFSVEGKEQLPDMDVNLNLSATASALATPVETNADGSVFQFDPTSIVWSVQDGAIVSFTPNPDGTATFVPLNVGSTQVGVSDSATGLSATAMATVIQAGPTSMEIQWSNVTAR